MTLGFMKKGTKQSWDEIPMPDTVIDKLNELVQVQSNELQVLDFKKHPIGYLKITGVPYGET